MAEELGLGISHKEFEEAQAWSKEASKGSGKKDSGDIVKLDVHDIAALEKNPDVPKTDDSPKFGPSQSSVYPLLADVLSGIGNITANIKAIFHNKKFVSSTAEIPEDATFGLLLDRTSFYAEAGGQEYDTGNIVIDDVADFEVTNVQVYNGYVLHTGRLKYGSLEVGNEVISSYDEVRQLYSGGIFGGLNDLSFDDGPCETTIRRHTSSTFACAKSWVTILIKKARSLPPPSCGSTSPTNLKFHFLNSRRSKT
jgi:alanyl-tRNA synthetase